MTLAILSGASAILVSSPSFSANLVQFVRLRCYILEHMDRLLRYFTSRMAARIPDAPFHNSDFDRLREQGIIKPESFSQHVVPESGKYRYATQQTMGIFNSAIGRRGRD